MLRQRLHARTGPLAFVGRVLVLLLAGALVWYGLMVLLLALKVAPATVDELSGYRTAFDWLAGLGPEDVDGQVRAIGAAAGLVAFLVFGWCALQELPRPYLARSDLDLEAEERGELRVEPRAVERVAEVAAEQQPAVSDATGLYATDHMSANVSVNRARGVADTLRTVQRQARAALEEHDLPVLPVNVTLTGYDRRQKRELN
jgi:hypothetical protein